jgi:glycosyltransferase involved in cell wall biosynthesis
MPGIAVTTAATIQDAPLVSVGLPVYNGERYLADALDSLLAQTFENFEVVISDNASTDLTADIIERFAAKDSRIRCVRSDRNRGATWNSLRVQELARGRYFRWASHDDTIEPDYLAKCVAALEERPDAVLATSRVTNLDAVGNRTDYQRIPIPFEDPRPERRFGGLVMHADRCYEIFGLLRLDALRSIPDIGDFGHADGIVLTRLALLGTFVELPERLLNMRIHPDQSMSVYGAYGGPIDFRGWTEWFNPDKTGELQVPHWRRLWEHLQSPFVVPGLSVRTRMLCLLPIGRWAIRFRQRLAEDAVYAARVRLGRIARRTRRRRPPAARRPSAA